MCIPGPQSHRTVTVTTTVTSHRAHVCPCAVPCRHGQRAAVMMGTTSFCRRLVQTSGYFARFSAIPTSQRGWVRAWVPITHAQSLEFHLECLFPKYISELSSNELWSRRTHCPDSPPSTVPILLMVYSVWNLPNIVTGLYMT